MPASHGSCAPRCLRPRAARWTRSGSAAHPRKTRAQRCSYAPAVVRRFVVIGQRASASDDFRVDDLPGTSGRLDVLVRCLRAALLSSHGLRRDVVVYLVLLGGSRAPRVVRVDGSRAQFIRPDERSLAVLVRKVLASRADEEASGFVPVKPGICVARGGLEQVLADAAGARPFVLEEGASDLRGLTDLGGGDRLFVIGDHLGLSDDVRARLDSIGARAVCVGPVSIHADDVVTVITNELDRLECGW